MGLMVARVVLEPSGLMMLQVIAPVPNRVAAKVWVARASRVPGGEVRVMALAMRVISMLWLAVALL